MSTVKENISKLFITNKINGYKAHKDMCTRIACFESI